MNIKTRINAALGNIVPDMVLKNGKIVNVLTKEIYVADVAIMDGIIVGIGEYEGKNNIDMSDKYIMPGFINAHCHVESSMTTPYNYSLAELMWGTTTIITDPHEIVNVAGHRGIQYILEEAKKAPLNYYVALPSCVPATSFEHAGAIITAKDLLQYKDDSNVIGLGEMMNYVGVNYCDEDVLAKVEAFSDKIVDGHAPALSGHALNAYKIAGIDTEHECVTYEEALEKARLGFAILVREGSASKNEEAILRGFIENGNSTQNLAFATDDKHLYNIYEEGTIRANINKAIELGMNCVDAIAMATINAARIYGLKKLGAIAPGYIADIVVSNSLEKINVELVIKSGEIVVREGKVSPILEKQQAPVKDEAIVKSVNIGEFNIEMLQIKDKPQYPVIEMLPEQIITKKLMIPRHELDRMLEEKEILKIAVIERHNATNNIGVGYIKGYGLKNGAVATTVGHDSHNLLVVGDNDKDMLAAVEEIVRIQGGYAIVSGEVIESLPLRVCGLMNDEKPQILLETLEKMTKAARKLGVKEGIDPFTTLSFMALPVIPELRITDMGMFDVTEWKLLD